MNDPRTNIFAFANEIYKLFCTFVFIDSYITSIINEKDMKNTLI